MDDTTDPRMAKALARYQVISPYLAAEPQRGQKRVLLEQLAARTWTGPDGEPFQRAAETIRVWVARYRTGGLDALMDKPRPRRGSSALSDEQIELACRLKREVAERSLDRIIAIMEGMGMVERGVVRRSTLHRALRDRGLSARKLRTPEARDLDRFEAAFPNDMWQSDLLCGPWLPDPDRPGKMRRAHLYAFLDDHSRLMLHGRFSFKGDLPALELVFRRSLQKWGVCRRVYYDNGQVYRSGHMKQVVAILGMHRIIHTKPYRPEGHGKIEAFNRLVRSSFIAELKATRIRTLDALNEAFVAWTDYEYNRRIHGQTGQTPLDRWRTGIERVRYADDEDLRQAFLWRERRKADKTGVFSLHGSRYQVSARLSAGYVEVRYDPEQLHEIEVWRDGRFMERVRPLDVQPHRRPVVHADEPVPDVAPTADWLGHLVQRRRNEGFVEPAPRAMAEQARASRKAADAAVVTVLHGHLDPEVVDETAAIEWLDRYGPLDPEHARAVLEDRIAQGEPTDQHVTVYLEAIRNAGKGGVE